MTGEMQKLPPLSRPVQRQGLQTKGVPLLGLSGFPLDGGNVELYHRKSEERRNTDSRLLCELYSDFGGWRWMTQAGEYGWVLS
jgi:hypothetical protein